MSERPGTKKDKKEKEKREKEAKKEERRRKQKLKRKGAKSDSNGAPSPSHYFQKHNPEGLDEFIERTLSSKQIDEVEVLLMI